MFTDALRCIVFFLYDCYILLVLICNFLKTFSKNEDNILK